MFGPCLCANDQPGYLLVTPTETCRAIFSAVPGEGTLASLSYLASPTGAAADENDYILYNTTSGALLYNADGNGQGVAIEFATLTNKPAIKVEDFLVVA